MLRGKLRRNSAVGRALVYDTMGPEFESGPVQNFRRFILAFKTFLSKAIIYAYGTVVNFGGFVSYAKF